MNTQKLAIFAAVGLGVFLLMGRSANAGTLTNPKTGSYRPIFGSVPGQNLTPTQQRDQLNTNTLYDLGRMVGGFFSGSSATKAPAAPSVNGGTSGGNYWRPSTFDKAPAMDVYGPPSYLGNSGDEYGPPAYLQDDSYAVNPPGGYEIPGSMSDGEMAYWN